MREGIVGFTLGELGILVAFVLLFVLAGLGRSSDTDVPDPNDIARARDSLEFALARADSLDAAFALAKDSLEVLRGKRSRQTPSCREVGVADGFLFTTEILGPDLFRVNNDTLSFRGIIGRFSESVNDAERRDCVHQVTSYAGPEVSGAALVDAQRQLEVVFYHSVR